MSLRRCLVTSRGATLRGDILTTLLTAYSFLDTLNVLGFWLIILMYVHLTCVYYFRVIEPLNGQIFDNSSHLQLPIASSPKFQDAAVIVGILTFRIIPLAFRRTGKWPILSKPPPPPGEGRVFARRVQCSCDVIYFWAPRTA